MALDWSVDVHDGIATVRPVGEIDYTGTEILRKGLNDAADRDGVRQIVVDMSDVSFVDSSALGLLVGAKRVAESRGIAFRLSAPRPGVTRILQLTNLFDHLVKPSIED